MLPSWPIVGGIVDVVTPGVAGLGETVEFTSTIFNLLRNYM